MLVRASTSRTLARADKHPFRQRLPLARWSGSHRESVRAGIEKKPGRAISDVEAFLTSRPYAYLVLKNVTKDDNWHVRLLNHNGSALNPLNATVRLSLSGPLPRRPPRALPNLSVESNFLPSAADVLCPRGPGPVSCSAHGTCQRGKCHCDRGHGGRYCESEVNPLQKGVISVPSERMLYFRYSVPRDGPVAIVMRLAPGQHLSRGARAILFAKRPGENGGILLAEGPPLPSTYDLRFTDKPAFVAGLSVQKVVRAGLRKGETLYIAVYNFHQLPPAWLLRRNPNLRAAGLAREKVEVQLEAFPCLDRREARYREVDEEPGVLLLRHCPVTAGHEQWMSVTFLLLPFLLGTLALLTMVVCLSIWASVFRQHIFEVIHGHSPDDGSATPTRRDKLSQAEVNAMFPAFVFTKGETGALGAAGDVCCSVCLCSFEEGEMLRRLACGHSYHSACLDQWLLTNATCPRCRKSARISGDATRGSWFSRRLFSGLWLSRVSWRALIPSFLSSRLRGPDTTDLESIEVEGLLSENEFSRRFAESP